MSELFNKRMNMLLQSGSLGGKLLEDSDILDDRNFSNDSNFKVGMLYDWDMNELEEVEFKFEKIKTWTADGSAVEYMIRFRPNYNPEYKFKDSYYRNDGKERFGFYILLAIMALGLGSSVLNTIIETVCMFFFNIL